MEIRVTKYTDVERLRRFNQAATGRPSKMTLKEAYRLGHTPIRTQRFVVELIDIPLFVASQLVRQRVGADWVMRSKRTDRGGEDFTAECVNLWGRLKVSAPEEPLAEELRADLLEGLAHFPVRFDRWAPTHLIGDLNAEALMNMARKRLCAMASKETQFWVRGIREEVAKCDPDLARHMVPQCVHRGGICPEGHECHLSRPLSGELKAYRELMARGRKKEPKEEPKED